MAFAQTTAVVYPNVRAPYQQIFLDIAEGVASVDNRDVKLYPMGETDSAEALQDWLREQKVEKVIALGKRGLETLPDLPQCITAVNGAVMLDPEAQGVSGISLAPAPQQMFRKLRALVPGVKDIHVVYSNKKNGGLIKRARAAAAAEGFNLLPQQASSIQDTAARYQTVLATMDRDKSALWLHHTGRSIDRAIMTQVLEVAWQRNLVVFSSNFSDVKRGVLFALYPDNYLLGKHLAHLAAKLRRQKPDITHQVLLLDALLTAVNLRTADHLGLHFSKSEKQAFDFMYPPP